MIYVTSDIIDIVVSYWLRYNPVASRIMAERVRNSFAVNEDMNSCGQLRSPRRWNGSVLSLMLCVSVLSSQVAPVA